MAKGSFRCLWSPDIWPKASLLLSFFLLTVVDASAGAGPLGSRRECATTGTVHAPGPGGCLERPKRLPRRWMVNCWAWGKLP